MTNSRSPVAPECCSIHEVESIITPTYTKEADIWSLGCLLSNLLVKTQLGKEGYTRYLNSRIAENKDGLLEGSGHEKGFHRSRSKRVVCVDEMHAEALRACGDDDKARRYLQSVSSLILDHMLQTERSARKDARTLLTLWTGSVRDANRPPPPTGFEEVPKKLRETNNGASNINRVELDTIAFRFAPSDSGYGTASRCGQVKVEATQAMNAPVSNNDALGTTAPENPVENNDDTRTLYSDGASFSDSTVDRYARALADDIAQRLSHRTTLTLQAVEKIVNALPWLLQVLALKLGSEATSQMHLDVMVFIHKYRGNITNKIRHHLGRGPSLVAGQGTEPWYSSGVLQEWLGSLSHPGLIPDDGEENRPLMDFSELLPQIIERGRNHSPGDPGSNDAEADEDDENLPLPGIENYNKIIRGDSAYEWLIDRLHRELRLSRQDTDIMEEVRQKILTALPPQRHVRKTQPSQALAVLYTINWDVKGFLAEQDYQQPEASAITNALTLTGSDTDAQALSCIDYMKQTWPQTGPFILGLIRQLLIPSHNGWATGRPKPKVP